MQAFLSFKNAEATRSGDHCHWKEFIIHRSQAGLRWGQSGGRKSMRKSGSQPSLLFLWEGQGATAQAGLELAGMNYFSRFRSSLQHLWLSKESMLSVRTFTKKKKKKKKTQYTLCESIYRKL